MEALSALNGQTQIPPNRRAATSAPRPQPSATVDPTAKSDNPDQSEQQVSRLAELAKTIGDRILNSVPSNSHLQIIRDEESGTFIYRILDSETGEIVSQYPAEEALRQLAFWSDLKGLSVDTTA